MEVEIFHFTSQLPVMSKDQTASMSRSYFSKTEIGIQVLMCLTKLVSFQILELQKLQKITHLNFESWIRSAVIRGEFETSIKPHFRDISFLNIFKTHCSGLLREHTV